MEVGIFNNATFVTKLFHFYFYLVLLMRDFEKKEEIFYFHKNA